MSEALFIIIGTLFLATEGTAGLGSWLDARTQVDLQAAIAAHARRVPDAIPLLSLCVIVLVAFARERRGKAYQDRTRGDNDLQ